MKISILTIPLITFLFVFCAKEDIKTDSKFSGKYDVGGHKLFLSSLGSQKPAVILESGFGDGGTMSGWDAVRKQVKDFAQICLYDRAGLGKSKKGPGPRNTLQIANELHALLEASQINPPYILVGHSMGGLHIQTYAMLYPNDVAAMVFVDPSPKEIMDTLSAEALENLVAIGASQAVLDETGPGLNASIPVFKSLPKLPDIPVVVITSSYTGEGGVDMQKWEELKAYHQKLSEEVTDGSHIVATKAGHYIQMDEPDLVVEAIRNVYNKIQQ